MIAVNKNDFIEIEFTGKANDEIFDTTKNEDAKKLNSQTEVKPIIISAGNEMLVKGFDKELIGKEIGKNYSIKLKPKEAFGERQSNLVKVVPLKVFHEKKINPQPGMTFQMDNYLVKVLNVSGGRVTADFNNPLSGKEIIYEFRVNKKITEDKEKINSLQDFFFKQRFDFEIKDNKVIFKKPEIKPLIEMMRPKLKEISGFEFEVEEKKKEKVDKEKTDNKTNDESTPSTSNSTNNKSKGATDNSK